MREGSKKILRKIPPAWDLAKRTEEHMKGMVAPGTLFEELGWNYIGPIDGHDLPGLLHTLENMRALRGPQLLHVLTMKGKGFLPAEEDPVGYHALGKIEPKPEPARARARAPAPPSRPKYQAIFGRWLCDMAEADERLIGITPAMCEGSGMVEFAERFPERFYDVAIAEQHAVTLAAGMACEGAKPVLAIYSTFLQRGYDQLIHDVALQNLDVLFALDRAGLVGEDGPTHGGVFDLSYLRCLPNVIVAAPSDENECRRLLYTCYRHEGPAAVRYPRGKGVGAPVARRMAALPIGESLVAREGRGGVAILSFGSLLPAALAAAARLDASVVDMRWVKPLDEARVLALAAACELLVTLEDNVLSGGAGGAVLELLARCGARVPVLGLGLPDEFVEHGKREEQLAWAGLDADGVLASIQKRLARLNSGRPALRTL